MRRLIAHDGLEMAGHLAFTALLSLFPFLLFLAALAGFLGDAETARKFIEFLFEFTPDDVAATLAPAVFEVLTARQGGLLTVSILGTLWVASSGVEALRLVLNRAYGVSEPRPIWWRRLQSLVIVVGAAVAILLASASIIVGPFLWDLLERIFGVAQGEWAWTVARYVVAALFLITTIIALHGLLPRHRPPLRRVLPGATATMAGWIALSTLFSIYLGTVGDYSATYGALGGGVISLLFFYFAGLAFIFGAELNAELMELPAEPSQGRPAAPQD